ncbi:protein MAIN-LIKE 1-like [Chenopodium quinoa]|uniref:protein MAIN-LIKE 1-like n=2 Tax=Chenopodium quinoa TaxID=63459 RepID=UPI000B76C00B|nr:protein MAIN-LIKE 1-like [Chenopodium quinoa]
MSRRPGKEVAAQAAGGQRFSGEKASYFRSGAGKSMDIMRSTMNSMESSGPRHVRSRGISASARRERVHYSEDDEDDDGDEEEEEEDADEDVDDQSGPYDDYGPFSQRLDDVYETRRVDVRKGRDGRFVSRSGTSSASTVSAVSRKRSRAVNDSWVVRGEVAGGPIDGSVIPSFLGHIATRIWEDQERALDSGILKCQTRERTCNFLCSWAEAWPEESEMVGRLRATRVSHLPATMHERIDSTLITAFVERWQPDTNSFHLPFGEMTIMLHDVEAILGIPVEGNRASVVTDADQADLLAELLAVDRAALYTAALGVWDHGGVKIAAVLQRCLHPTSRRTQDTQLAAYVFLLLGCTLFPDKSGNKLRPRDIVDACEPDRVGQFSWGSATLAYMYRQLGFSSRADAAGITGCMTLLQTWIYEYFPAFRPHRDPVPIGDGQPRACAWSPRVEKKSIDRLRSIRLLLDRMSPLEVNWMPFGQNPSNRVPRTLYTGLIQYREIVEAYMPQRCLRQLGYVQVVPPPPAWPSKAVRSASLKEYVVQWPASMIGTWEQFPMVARIWIEQLQRPPTGVAAMCDQHYMEWYNRHSHPRLIRDVHHGDDADDDDVPPPTAVDAVRLIKHL